MNPAYGFDISATESLDLIRAGDLIPVIFLLPDVYEEFKFFPLLKMSGYLQEDFIPCISKKTPMNHFVAVSLGAVAQS